MSLKAFRKDLKTCKAVYGYVQYSKDEGTMMELKKTDLLWTFKDHPENTEICYSLDSTNRMYIDSWGA